MSKIFTLKESIELDRLVKIIISQEIRNSLDERIQYSIMCMNCHFRAKDFIMSKSYFNDYVRLMIIKIKEKHCS